MTGDSRFTFKFTVLGRYDARLEDNEPHVTISAAAGRNEHFVFCGTLTMSEGHWRVLSAALTRELKGGVEIEDHRPPPADG